MRTARVMGLVALLAVAGCGGGQTDATPTSEPTTATAKAEAPGPEEVTADQGDVTLCRTHNDIAKDSRLFIRSDMPAFQLRDYVQGWNDDLSAASRAAVNTRLRADVSAVVYELALLNAELTIALNDTSDDPVDVQEQLQAIKQASQKVASTCRLEVGGADYSEVLFSTVG